VTGLKALAHKFMRLNDSRGLSAFLRNFFLLAIANPVGAISESVLSDFNGLRRQFRAVSFFLFFSWPPKAAGKKTQSR
jgi:hypothetical protein